MKKTPSINFRALIHPSGYLILTLTAGLTNYLFFPIAKHFLGLARFGDVVTYTSIIAVFGALLVAQQMYAIAYFPNTNPAQQLAIMIRLRNKAYVLAALFSLIYLPGGWLFLHLLNIHDAMSYVLLFVYFWILVVSNLVSSYWHAKSHLVKLALFMVATSVLQLVLEAVFLRHSPIRAYAIASLLFGQVITLLAVMVRFPDVRSIITQSGLTTALSQVKELTRITLPVLGLYVFLNCDIFIAKAFLSSQQAGYYAAYSTMIRVMFFVVVAIVGIFLPRMAGRSGEAYRRELKLLTILSFVTVVGIWLIGIVLYPLLLRLLYGLGGNWHLYALLLPSALGLTAIYVTTLLHIIQRRYARASQLVAIVLIAAVLSAIGLSHGLFLAPLAVSISSVVGLLFLMLQFLVKPAN